MTIFLARKGIIECEIAQHPGNFITVFIIIIIIFAAIFKIFQNLMISPENFDQKSKTGGSLGVNLLKRAVINQCRERGLLTGA